MLKTSSTKSVEPKKDVPGVSSGGRNIAEPIGKYELDDSDNDGSGSSDDFNRKFHLL